MGGLLSTVGWVGSSRPAEAGWQNATHTVFWDKTELIMRIAVVNVKSLTKPIVVSIFITTVSYQNET